MLQSFVSFSQFDQLLIFSPVTEALFFSLVATEVTVHGDLQKSELAKELFIKKHKTQPQLHIIVAVV